MENMPKEGPFFFKIIQNSYKKYGKLLKKATTLPLYVTGS